MRFWRIVYWILCAGFVLTAALNLARVHVAFWTTHAADLIVPAFLYVVTRGLAGTPPNIITRIVGRTPERAAIALFVASTLTELSQIWWPRGFFAGVFDPLDIAAYAIGVGACYVAERVSATRPLPSASPPGSSTPAAPRSHPGSRS